MRRTIAAVLLLLCVCAPVGAEPHPKLLHFLGGGFISLMGAGSGHENVGLFSACAAGVTKEIYDGFTEHERFSSHVRDVGITTAGGAIPWGVRKLIKHYKKREAQNRLEALQRELAPKEPPQLDAEK